MSNDFAGVHPVGVRCVAYRMTVAASSQSATERHVEVSVPSRGERTLLLPDFEGRPRSRRSRTAVLSEPRGSECESDRAVVVAVPVVIETKHSRRRFAQAHVTQLVQ